MLTSLSKHGQLSRTLDAHTRGQSLRTVRRNNYENSTVVPRIRYNTARIRILLARTTKPGWLYVASMYRPIYKAGDRRQVEVSVG